MKSSLKLPHLVFKGIDLLVGAGRPKGDWFPVCLIVSVVVATYLMSLGNRFSPEDETLGRSALVTGKQVSLRQFFGSACRQIEWGGATYRPLVMMSLARDYQKRGLDFYQFRRTNAAFHA